MRKRRISERREAENIEGDPGDAVEQLSYPSVHGFEEPRTAPATIQGRTTRRTARSASGRPFPTWRHRRRPHPPTPMHQEGKDPRRLRGRRCRHQCVREDDRREVRHAAASREGDDNGRGCPHAPCPLEQPTRRRLSPPSSPARPGCPALDSASAAASRKLNGWPPSLDRQAHRSDDRQHTRRSNPLPEPQVVVVRRVVSERQDPLTDATEQAQRRIVRRQWWESARGARSRRRVDCLADLLDDAGPVLARAA